MADHIREAGKPLGQNLQHSIDLRALIGASRFLQVLERQRADRMERGQSDALLGAAQRLGAIAGQIVDVFGQDDHSYVTVLSVL